MNIISGIVESLFPIYCVGCKNRGEYICSRCAKQLFPAQAPKYTWITSIFSYTDPKIRNLIRILKFKNGKGVAKFFAPYVALALNEFVGEEANFSVGKGIILIPMPLSKKRFRKRGYNQSLLILNEAMKTSGYSNFQIRTDIVKKVKDTKAQSDIKKRADRLQNIEKDFFVVNANTEDMRKTVIIIDDVVTTGATLSAVRAKLRERGFRKIYALTVAH